LEPGEILSAVETGAEKKRAPSHQQSGTSSANEQRESDLNGMKKSEKDNERSVACKREEKRKKERWKPPSCPKAFLGIQREPTEKKRKNDIERRGT